MVGASLGRGVGGLRQPDAALDFGNSGTGAGSCSA